MVLENTLIAENISQLHTRTAASAALYRYYGFHGLFIIPLAQTTIPPSSTFVAPSKNPLHISTHSSPEPRKTLLTSSANDPGPTHGAP